MAGTCRSRRATARRSPRCFWSLGMGHDCTGRLPLLPRRTRRVLRSHRILRGPGISCEARAHPLELGIMHRPRSATTVRRALAFVPAASRHREGVSLATAGESPCARLQQQEILIGLTKRHVGRTNPLVPAPPLKLSWEFVGQGCPTARLDLPSSLGDAFIWSFDGCCRCFDCRFCGSANVGFSERNDFSLWGAPATPAAPVSAGNPSRTDRSFVRFSRDATPAVVGLL